MLHQYTLYAIFIAYQRMVRDTLRIPREQSHQSQLDMHNPPAGSNCLCFYAVNPLHTHMYTSRRDHIVCGLHLLPHLPEIYVPCGSTKISICTTGFQGRIKKKHVV